MAKSNRLAAVVLALFPTGAGLVMAWAAVGELRSIQRGASLEAIALVSLCCGVAMILLPRGILLFMIGLLDYRGRWAGHVYFLLVFSIMQVLGMLCVGVSIACLLLSSWDTW